MTDDESRDQERLEAGMFAAAALADSMGIRFEDALALMIRAYLRVALGPLWEQTCLAGPQETE